MAGGKRRASPRKSVKLPGLRMPASMTAGTPGLGIAFDKNSREGNHATLDLRSRGAAVTSPPILAVQVNQPSDNFRGGVHERASYCDRCNCGSGFLVRSVRCSSHATGAGWSGERCDNGEPPSSHAHAPRPLGASSPPSLGGKSFLPVLACSLVLVARSLGAAACGPYL